MQELKFINMTKVKLIVFICSYTLWARVKVFNATFNNNSVIW